MGVKALEKSVLSGRDSLLNCALVSLLDSTILAKRVSRCQRDFYSGGGGPENRKRGCSSSAGF